MTAPAPLPDDVLAPARIGRYVLVRPLGSGGVGTVYEARDTADDRVVALKVLDIANQEHREQLQAMTREAMAAASVQHRHVMACSSFGEDAEHLYLALEYLPGGDTRSLLERSGGRLHPDATLRLGVQCADGLAAVHDAGLLHRDLKPANILLDRAGEAKIADLGLALYRGHGSAPSTLIAGTPAYLAPEVARGGAHSVASDVYALGATLYHWTTGSPPFTGTVTDILTRLAQDGTPNRRVGEACPACPEGLARVIEIAMAPDPTRRHRSAAHLAADLRAVSAGLPPAPSVPPGGPPPAGQEDARWRAGHRLVRGTVLGAVVLGMAFVAGWIHAQHRPSPVPHPDGTLSLAATPLPRLAEGYALRFTDPLIAPADLTGTATRCDAGAGIACTGLGGWVGHAPALVRALALQDAFTVDGFVRIVSLDQDGPARIFAISLNEHEADLVVGQSGSRIEVRLRTTATDPDGRRPDLITAPGVLHLGWHRLTLVREPGRTTLYLDGVRAGTAVVPGSLRCWDAGYPLVVGDEQHGGFPWCGTLTRVVLYDRALTAQDIARTTSTTARPAP